MRPGPTLPSEFKTGQEAGSPIRTIIGSTVDKNPARLRRAKATRSHIAKLNVPRLTVHRSDQHIYAQVISADGGKVLACGVDGAEGSGQGSERHEEQDRRCGCRQGDRREGESGWRREGRVRSFRFPLPRPHCGVGGCGARRWIEVLEDVGTRAEGELKAQLAASYSSSAALASDTHNSKRPSRKARSRIASASGNEGEN